MVENKETLILLAEGAYAKVYAIVGSKNAVKI